MFYLRHLLSVAALAASFAHFTSATAETIIDEWSSVKVPAPPALQAVTVDPKTMYLDQIVVAPEAWGSGVALALLEEAKRLSPRGLDLLVNKDNFRAIRFYEKHGFVLAGEDKNPVSGLAVNRMTWHG